MPQIRWTVDYDARIANTSAVCASPNLPKEKTRGPSGLKKKNYIGLSSTRSRSSIAIVGSSGELLFAGENAGVLDGNGVVEEPGALATLIVQYCEPEADVVIALTSSRSRAAEVTGGPSPDIGALESWLKKESVQSKQGYIPRALRAAAATSAYNRHCNTYTLSKL